MKTLLALSITALLVCSLPASACTPEEAVAKAEELAAKVAQITDSDPEKAAEINRELKQRQIERTTEGLPNECAAYDRRIKELDQAAEDAGVEADL
jgi:hypothetical protein